MISAELKQTLYSGHSGTGSTVKVLSLSQCHQFVVFWLSRINWTVGNKALQALCHWTNLNEIFHQCKNCIWIFSRYGVLNNARLLSGHPVCVQLVAIKHRTGGSWRAPGFSATWRRADPRRPAPSYWWECRREWSYPSTRANKTWNKSCGICTRHSSRHSSHAVLSGINWKKTVVS